LWKEALKGAKDRGWLGDADGQTRQKILSALDHLALPNADRGAEFRQNGDLLPLLNHSTRSHIRADLERYLFASAFASAHGRSPALSDFPTTLLPDHENVDQAMGNGMFSDRFRVQIANSPATTVTSHISKDGHYYIHYDPAQCRSLTVREAARLQTFPDDYFFCGPRTSQYSQVGNAVPPRLASHIAGVVAQALS
jgi:DNA (cytosine-5)-methyltransferase 1